MKKQFNLLFVIAFVLLASIGCQNSEPEDKSEENPVRVSDTNIGIVGTWQLVDYEPHDFEELPEMILVTKMDFSWSVTTIIQSVAFGKLIIRLRRRIVGVSITRRLLFGELLTALNSSIVSHGIHLPTPC